MKTLSGIMSHTSKEQYLESCRLRYPSRNRAGKSAMISEVSDTLGWDRKHTIKALGRKVSHGQQAKRRGSKPTHGAAERAVIIAIWKHSEQPCGLRLKQTLPLWLESYQARHGAIDEATRAKILGYSPRTLERITAPHRRVEWTRSRAYKKNDQAHVEQKNFTHVRQLLGYGRFGDLALREQVNDLYEKAWLPLRNYFTPVMKLIEKQRLGSKIRKKYDTPATPCDRLLGCAKVSEETKTQLRQTRAALDPMDLAADIETRLGRIFAIIERIEEDREDEIARAEAHPGDGTVGAVSVPSPVATAPCASTATAPTENLVKTTPKNHNQTKRWVS